MFGGNVKRWLDRLAFGILRENYAMSLSSSANQRSVSFFV